MTPDEKTEVTTIAREVFAESLKKHGLDVRQHVLTAILSAVQAEAKRQVAAQMPAPGESLQARMTAIREEVARQMAALEQEIERRFQALLPVIRLEMEQRVAALIPPPKVLEVRTGRRKRPTRVAGPHHRLLPDIIRMASARTPDGFPIPLWLYGPPGSGKSMIAEQVAKAVGVTFYPVPLGPSSTESKLLGYCNILNGQFIPGLLSEPFRKGGLAFLDESDVADPGVLVAMNSLISGGRFRFPNGEVVERHPGFFLLAGANTIGTGGKDDFVRNKLDAAFLDRFVKFKVDYDPELESALCGNLKWVTYAQRARSCLQQTTSKTRYVTARTILQGAALLEAGIPATVVVDTVLLSGDPKDLRRSLETNIGQFIP